MSFTKLDYALAAARRGWPVFPLRPLSKQPAIKAWERQATTDVDRVRAWWGRWPDANIGIATGPARLVAIDLDKPKAGQMPPPEWDKPGVTDGADVFAALAERAGTRIMLDTFAVRTRRGGMHLYYTAPEGVLLGNTSGSHGNGLGWLIDTRAAGGYVAGPGSHVEDMDGSGDYTAIITADPAPLPNWLTRALTTRLGPGAGASLGERVSSDGVLTDIAAAPPNRRSAYAQAALRGEIDRVLSAPEGQRNTSLYVAAVSLGQLAAQRLLGAEEIAAALRAAAHAANTHGAPNPPGEIDATIRSGLSKGLTVPRRTRQGAA